MHAVFDSPDGIGGVGLGNLGGGVGGHMKALGVVPGDDVIERLVLGQNLIGDLDSFRTEVEDCWRMKAVSINTFVVCGKSITLVHRAGLVYGSR